MGIERMHPPKYWRMRAEEFRTKADNCKLPQTRDSLLRVTENYDAIARSAEQLRNVDERPGRSDAGSRREAQRMISEKSLRRRRPVRA